MARLPTFSPTKFTTYLTCPVKYYWTYLDQRGNWYKSARPQFSFGSSLHKALERLHDPSDLFVTTPQEAVAALDDHWIDAGYGSAEEAAEARSLGRAVVENYAEAHKERDPEVKTLAVEKTLRFRYDDWDLMGRVDRLDVWPDGTLEVIDYKSGRSTVEESDVADDIAMGLYALLAKRANPDASVKATIIALRSGDGSTHLYSENEIEEVEGLAKELAHQIMVTEFSEIRPVAIPACLGCDFQPLCARDHEYKADLARLMAEIATASEEIAAKNAVSE